MSIAALYSACQAQANKHYHRQMLWLTGEQAWCYQQLNQLREKLLSTNSIGVFNKDVIEKHFNTHNSQSVCRTQISANNCYKQLGYEYQTVIFDGFSGFNPDHLAQISGTLVGGGVFILITPDSAHWDDWQDPELDNLWAQPYSKNEVTKHFLMWIKNALMASEEIARYSQSSTQNSFVNHAKEHPTQEVYISSSTNKSTPDLNSKAQQDQQRLVAQCRSQLLADKDANAVITAPRGRGKSVALGLLCQSIKHQRAVYLTAANPLAVSKVIAFAENDIEYQSPTQLLSEQCRLKANALLLVDEAASISVDVLVALMKKFNQIVFSTTTEGYEGTGQGFTLRFLKYVDKHSSQCHYYHLNEPMRWAANDPLESWFNQYLLLNPHSIQHTQSNVPLAVLPAKTTYRIEKVSTQALILTPLKLQQLYALLTQAHYRTAPSDLRVILDSPGMHLWIINASKERSEDVLNNKTLEIKEEIVAVCLVALEDKISSFAIDAQGMSGDELAQAMYQGSRRPRGNLIAQTLIAQEGYLAAKDKKIARVVRIATHHQYRRNQLASDLLRDVEQWSNAQQCHFMAASFALQQDVIGFWQQQGFSLVRVGSQIDKVTASYNAMVLKPLECEQAALNIQIYLPLSLFDQLIASFDVRFSFQKNHILDYNNYEYLNATHKEVALPINITNWSWYIEQISMFAYYHRPFEGVGNIILLLLNKYPQLLQENAPPNSCNNALNSQEIAILKQYFYKHQMLESIQDEFKISGYRGWVKEMRVIAQKILIYIEANK